jgi:hypothetical protein
MTTKTIQKVSIQQLVELFKEVINPTFVHVQLFTEVGMNKTNNPFYGLIFKSSKRNYLVGSNYENRVRVNEGKEGFDADFVSEKPSGKTHVTKVVLVSDKDPNQFYVMLEMFDEVPPIVEYFMNGEPIEKIVFEGYLKPISQSAKQVQDKKVKVITPKIESIKSVSMNGIVYEVEN